jgi:hypothetical protein
MAFRSFKKDIDKFYQRIDKIAKKGRDNFQEYYNYVDDCIFKSQYGILTQVLFLKYDFDYTKFLSVDDVKSRKKVYYHHSTISCDVFLNVNSIIVSQRYSSIFEEIF